MFEKLLPKNIDNRYRGLPVAKWLFAAMTVLTIGRFVCCAVREASQMVKNIAFVDCTQSRLDDLFGLRSTLSSSVLDRWLQGDAVLSQEEIRILQVFGPVLTLARFTEPYRFNLFALRRIKATVPSVEGDIELSGEPDGMIATGYLEPKIPMFAFSEYKRQLQSDGDPVGQTLAAMLVGQALDEREKPLYGCYIVGYDWHFMVLEGRKYTISHDFSAITDSIFDIFRILKVLRQIIMELTPEPV